MNIGDLPNPSAAAQLVRDFRRRFSAKTCMAPLRDCAGSVVSAHTLSLQSMLRPLSREGHVYSVHTDLLTANEQNATRLALTGLRKTSVFNGFCEKHDRDLFSPIENEPFRCTPEQCFLHSFRATAKECYLKRKQAESLPPPEMIEQIHGLSGSVRLQMSDFAVLHQAASLRGAEDVERIKERLDAVYAHSDWRRLCTTVVPFSAQPPLACCFLYAPDFDFSGHYLQRFEDTDNDLSHLMITVLPSDNGGFALLSHLDNTNSAPRALVDSLLSQADITSALTWLIACQTENFALSPDWFEALPEVTQREFVKGFASNIDRTNVSFNQLEHFSLRVPSWRPGRAFTI